ncbi:MAG TPA: hypothetical protein VL358_04815 [Caulobacteraceae bacterium]|jgi:hypothetical protein|nr:hypothetical protein [Caulobacteraceae bacterium]
MTNPDPLREALEKIRDQPLTAPTFGGSWSSWAKAVARNALASLAAPALDRREVVARYVWFVFGDGLSPEDAIAPANDGYWECVKSAPGAQRAWTCADAILAATATLEELESDAGEAQP